MIAGLPLSQAGPTMSMSAGPDHDRPRFVLTLTFDTSPASVIVPCMEMDDDACYRAIATRDSRFDGRFFVAVRTTGIYCRPICPAPLPRRDQVCFYPPRPPARRRGFVRVCAVDRRRRPSLAPGRAQEAPYYGLSV